MGTVLEAVGNTPLVELRRVVPKGSARVLAKLESANPTGSMKDRMALSVIAAAEASGRLRPGGTVVEYTGGTTGVSLAFVCAAKGYAMDVFFSDAFAAEKGRIMQAFGARVHVVPSVGGKITADLIQRMIAAAQEASRKPGHWWCDQLRNEDAVAGYEPMGEEIWTQSGGRVDAFVHSVGSAHSIHGVSRALRRHNPRLHVTAMEPAESAVLSGGPTGAHRIEGIGIGFVPPLWHADEVSEVVGVSTAESQAMARRLAAEEGVFGGTSTGGNVVAALRVAERLGPGHTVVTLVVDSGTRYVSTELFA